MAFKSARKRIEGKSGLRNLKLSVANSTRGVRKGSSPRVEVKMPPKTPNKKPDPLRASGDEKQKANNVVATVDSRWGRAIPKTPQALFNSSWAGFNQHRGRWFADQRSARPSQYSARHPYK